MLFTLYVLIIHIENTRQLDNPGDSDYSNTDDVKILQG